MKYQDTGLTIFYGDARVRDKAETDETRLERIYDEYAVSLFRYALSLTGSTEDAEDAVQEVFVRIAHEPRRLTTVENLRAYLLHSTRNAAYTILRVRMRKERLDEAAFREELVSCSIQLEETAISVSVVREAFPQLPIEQREVLVLKVFDDLTFKEIAEITGASINTVAARYRYGIERLRRVLTVAE